MTKVGWKIDRRTSFETWSTQGSAIYEIDGSIAWWQGDWCNFGEDKFGEQYAQAVRESGYSHQTLLNRAYIARQIPFERRREELSFAHHSEVAGFDADEQDRLLQWVVDNRATAKGLREYCQELRALRRGYGAGAPGSQESVVAAPQGVSTGEAVPEAREVGHGPAEAQESDATETDDDQGYAYCPKHGAVLKATHRERTGCKETLGPINGHRDEIPLPSTVAESPQQQEPPAQRTSVSVAALYDRDGKLNKSQAESFVVQHEREMIEDLGGDEPEWLGDYIAWVFEAIQGIGPRHTAADAFAAGYAAGKASRD